MLGILKHDISKNSSCNIYQNCYNKYFIYLICLIDSTTDDFLLTYHIYSNMKT